uniref:Uncharacterized protein n=1 Tax=Sphaerodactylus townsendi TaxID=933632 RepID=A0ACB8FA62_9SAUR
MLSRQTLRPLERRTLLAPTVPQCMPDIANGEEALQETSLPPREADAFCCLVPQRGHGPCWRHPPPCHQQCSHRHIWSLPEDGGPVAPAPLTAPVTASLRSTCRALTAHCWPGFGRTMPSAHAMRTLQTTATVHIPGQGRADTFGGPPWSEGCALRGLRACSCRDRASSGRRRPCRCSAGRLRPVPSVELVPPDLPPPSVAGCDGGCVAGFIRASCP